MPKKPESIHAKCRAVGRDSSGHDLICGKSKGHDRSTDPKRREHFDPSKDERWADPAPRRKKLTYPKAHRALAALRSLTDTVDKDLTESEGGLSEEERAELEKAQNTVRAICDRIPE